MAPLRQVAECNVDALWNRIGTLPNEFTPIESGNFLATAGLRRSCSKAKGKPERDGRPSGFSWNKLIRNYTNRISFDGRAAFETQAFRMKRS